MKKRQDKRYNPSISIYSLLLTVSELIATYEKDKAMPKRLKQVEKLIAKYRKKLEVA